MVVNNAGIDCEAPVVDLDIDLLDRCLTVNVRGPLLLCKFALPTLIAQRSGSILCITSGAARAYRSGRVGYSMSKAALERMFLCLAEEVRPYNIAVNVLSPGRVDTWMTAMVTGQGPVISPWNSRIPSLPRRSGLPLDRRKLYGAGRRTCRIRRHLGPRDTGCQLIEPPDIRTPPCAHETRPEPSAADGEAFAEVL